MKNPLVNIARALVTLSVISTVSIFYATFAAILVFIKIIAPKKSWRKSIAHGINQIPCWWSDAIVNQWIKTYHIKTHITIDRNITPEYSYLLIANHRSMADIFFIHYCCNHRSSMIRFLLKRVLIYIPFVGWACWLLNYPFMDRNNRKSIQQKKDLKTIHSFSKRYQSMPVTLVNFTEGTRFTLKKQANQSSPYKHLLKPKVGAIAQTLRSMQEQAHAIIDITLDYHTSHCGFLDLLKGNIHEVSIHCQVRPITEDLRGDYQNDREFRKHLQAWANQVWEEKDITLEKNHLALVKARGDRG